MPRVTSLICTYRRPRQLARTLASLATQTFRDFDVEIFDNASGDQTPDVVAWFQRKGLAIKYHCHPENIGFEHNFAYAMSQTITSEFCHILNDDDYVLDRFFEHTLGGFERLPEAVFSATQTAWVGEDGRVLNVPLAAWDRKIFLPGAGAAHMLLKGHPEFTTMLYRSDWIGKSGGLEFQKYGPACDVPFHVLAAATHAMVAVPEVGGVYSLHPTQISSDGIQTDYSVFINLFAKLEQSSFLTGADFHKTLRAAARRHIYTRRHLRGSWAGSRREWEGLRGLAGMIATRPDHAFDAVSGYVLSLVDVVGRALRPSRTSGASTLRPAEADTLTRQIAAFQAKLEHDFVIPCLASVGLKNNA